MALTSLATAALLARIPRRRASAAPLPQQWQMAAFKGFGSAPKSTPKEKFVLKKGEEPCACGSLKPYAECCQPYHREEKYPETAVDLLRARFSAFANKKKNFIKISTDPEHLVIRKVPANRLIDEIEFSCSKFFYDKLAIMNDEPGEVEGEHWVKFRYWYRFTADVRGQGAKVGEQRSQTERSLFRKRDGRWRYIDTPNEYVDSSTFDLGDTREKQTNLLLKAKDAALLAQVKAAEAVMGKVGGKPDSAKAAQEMMEKMGIKLD
eukprot:EG_transcript_18295